jgi:hypothetical protein
MSELKNRSWRYHATKEAKIFEAGENIEQLEKDGWAEHPSKVNSVVEAAKTVEVKETKIDEKPKETAKLWPPRRKTS